MSPVKKVMSSQADQAGLAYESVHQQHYEELQENAKRERLVAESAQADNERLQRYAVENA